MFVTYRFLVGFYNPVGIQNNTKFLEKYFFEYVEKNFVKIYNSNI